jgi:hypothetical protein
MVTFMKATLLWLAMMTITAISVPAADSLYGIPLKDIDGKDTTLQPYAGKVLLLVNVASHCGYTKQYAALQSVYENPNPHVSMARSCWAGFSAGTSAGGAALTEVMAIFGSRNG